MCLKNSRRSHKAHQSSKQQQQQQQQQQQACVVFDAGYRHYSRRV
jgi:hypothetical protein